MRARILLQRDTNRAREEGASCQDEEVVASLGCTLLTVYKVRRRPCKRGVLGAVEHKEQENRKARALDGAQEAHLVALTCFAPPLG